MHQTSLEWNIQLQAFKAQYSPQAPVRLRLLRPDIDGAVDLSMLKTNIIFATQ